MTKAECRKPPLKFQRMKRVANRSRIFWLSLFFLSVLTVVSCSTTRSVPIEEGWSLLAERKVDFISDKDEIDVSSPHQFTAIKFRVEEKEVRINDLKVTFDNGDRLAPALDLTIPPGQESKLIELGSEGRTIRKIEFKYRSTGNVLQGRANVMVFGKKAVPAQK